MSQKDLYYGVLQFAQKRQNYGGLMIWNRYYDKKTGYLAGL
jgi:chitinase